MANEKTTLITNTSYVVGCENDQHYLLKNGQIAYRGNEIVFVGKQYEGPVDERIDARGGFVVPGLINLHCHLANSSQEKGFIEDTGSPYMYMTGMYEYLYVTMLDPRFQMGVYNFSILDVMSKGSTTVFDQGMGMPEQIEALGRAGIRAYVGPMAHPCDFRTLDGRVPHYDWDLPHGYARLEETIRLKEKYDGSFNDRIRIAFDPLIIDGCPPEYLKVLRQMMDAYPDMICAIHAAQSVIEYNVMIQRYGLSPADYLAEYGICGPNVHYGHYILPARHSLNAFKTGNELKTIADTKTNVVHCPWTFGRRGIIMESFQKYQDLGINMCLGTDTFPQDILNEMRYAAVFCKIAEGCNPYTGTAASIFNAATLNAAKALNRPDLGRLQPGAKADMLLIATDNLECTPLRDPIKVLVYTAASRNIERVIIDGEEVVTNGVAKYIDAENARQQMQAAQELMLQNIPNRDWAHRDQYELSPMSFPVRE